MHLNRGTDIGIRALMLAGAHPGQLTVDGMADALEVSRHHLAKVVQRLQRLGLLVTTRGRGGGVSCTEAALDASVRTVVEALEGNGEVVTCDDPPCPLRGTCRLRGVLAQAHEAFLAALAGVRIRDLLQDPTGPALVEIQMRPPPARSAT